MILPKIATTTAPSPSNIYCGRILFRAVCFGRKSGGKYYRGKDQDAKGELHYCFLLHYLLNIGLLFLIIKEFLIISDRDLSRAVQSDDVERIALQRVVSYKLCGCRNTTYAKIILMTDLILVAASALLAFSLRNVIILGEGNDSTASFLISVGFIAFICISPIILTVLSARRLSFSELLYFGD